MRIVHVTTFLQGGAGRIITALATAQRRAGHDVMVAGDAGGEPGYESYPEYLDALAHAGIPFHAVTSTFKRDLAVNVHAAAELRAATGPQPVDIAHAHAAVPSMIARLAFAGRRYVPVVQTMHGWGVKKSAEQAATDIALLGLADVVVTPSHAALNTLVGLGLKGVPTHVIPYGIASAAPEGEVDIDDLTLLDRLHREQRHIALCIGTIGERKNQALLIRALAQPGCGDIDAVLIGEGDATSLLRLADEFGVASRVHVLGYRRDASRYLARADVFVLPSRNEGLPIAVLEAMRAEVPVVGSAIPEIAEAVRDGATGFLFAPERADALAAALSRAAQPPDIEALRRRLREEFDTRFVQERMIEAYEQLYAGLLR
jgi:L-malate glycosyltransferase